MTSALNAVTTRMLKLGASGFMGVAGIMASIAIGSGSALAQDFPNRALRLIVPFQAGSTTDIIARMYATALSERLKQPVTIDTRLGAGGIVGGTALLRAAPDGYTLGLLVAGNSIQTWVVKDMPFDVRKDFAHITQLYAGYSALLVASDFPARNLADFIAYAKANPGKIFFGSSGAATTTHLAGELLNEATGIRMTHVPYKGSSEVITAMFSGSIQTYFDLYGTAKALIDSGKVRPLAVTSLKRMAELPQVPALAETYPGFEIAARVGVAAPLGTPRPVMDKLVAESRAVLQDAGLRRRIAALGIEPGGSSPEEYARGIASDTEKWGRAVRAAGITPQ